MATITCSFSINGIVNGQRFSYTDSWTVEDIYDVAVASSLETRIADYAVGMGNLQAVTTDQNCPSFIFAVNKSASETAILDIIPEGAGSTYGHLLRPGQFIIAEELSTGQGIVFQDTAGTATTLENVERLQFNKVPDWGFVPIGEIMVAFKGTT
jgi:hypothetical protein